MSVIKFKEDKLGAFWINDIVAWMMWFEASIWLRRGTADSLKIFKILHELV